jgi:hypothetical protein
MKKALLVSVCLCALALSACSGSETAANSPDMFAGKPAAPANLDGQNAFPGALPSNPGSAARKIGASEAAGIANAAGAGESHVASGAAPYVGLWHASPVLGSVWAERFMFGNNGSFVWAASQMDSEARIRYLFGAWEVQGESLALDAALMLCADAGELAAGDLLGGSAPKGALLVPYAISERFAMPLAGPEIDPGMLPEREMRTVAIDGKKYWRCEEEQGETLDEFLGAMHSLESQAASGGAWQPAYSEVLAAYGAALKKGFSQYGEGVVSEMLAEAARFDASLANLACYAFKDIDGNGTPELAIGAGGAGEPAIYDVYAFDGARAVRLIDDGSLGYRAWCCINADGTIPLWGGQGAGVGAWSFCRIAPDGHTLSLIEQIGTERGDNWDSGQESLAYYHIDGAGANKQIARKEYIQIGSKHLRWDGERLNGSLAPMDWKPLASYNGAEQ